MHPYHDICLKGALDWLQETRKASARNGLRICVLGGTGHGDKARQLAFCVGVRAKYPDAHIFFLAMPFAEGSAMVDYDMACCAAESGTVDGYYFMAGVDREPLVQDLLPHFDVLFDAIPYAVKAYWSNAVYANEQYDADQLLAPYRWLYDAHPEDDHRLRHRAFNIWDVMSRSSGIEAMPFDLALVAPLDCAPWPSLAELTTPLTSTGEVDPEATLAYIKEHVGSSDEKNLTLGYVGDYVIVHNSAGRGGRSKVAAPTVFKAIISFLVTEGVRAVQIGRHDDAKLADSVIDRRGLRLPLSNRLLAAPECLGLIGIDSLPMYMAAGVGMVKQHSKAAMILFGSTDPRHFGLPGNMNCVHVRQADSGVQYACRLSGGTCFRLPGYGTGCMLPKEANDDPEHCLNTLPPEDAAHTAVDFVREQRARRDDKTPVEEALA